MQHKDIVDSELHQVKGAASATLGQILIAQGDGTAEFENSPYSATKFGFWDYNDTATQTTPIALSVAGTEYQLTNNGLGVNSTTVFKLPGVDNVFNTSTNYFDFTDLSIGDTVDMRVDLSVTTTGANNVLELLLELGIGVAPFKLSFASLYVKTASTTNIVITCPFYIGSALTRDNPARLLMKNDSTGATVKVNGWYVRVLTNG